MEEFKNGYAWFGSFEISSGFLANILNIIMIGVLIVKLVLIKYVRELILSNRCQCACRLLRRKVFKRIPHGVEMKVLVIEELFLTSIFMVVSAASCLLSQGFLLWR